MAFPSTDELREVVEPIVATHNMDIEGVKVTRAGKKSQVIIYLDSDQRPSSDQLEVVSHDIGETFDDAEAAGSMNFGAGYTLEVSTPGVEMALTKPRHWRRNRHRLVSVNSHTGGGSPQTWRIGALNEDESAVILMRAEKKGRTVVVHQLAQSVHAVVKIEFSQPSEAEREVTHLPFADAAADAADMDICETED